MNVTYEVPLSETRKFVALVNEDKRTITMGEYYRSPEGWLAAEELFVRFNDLAMEPMDDIERAIVRAFSHFRSPQG